MVYVLFFCVGGDEKFDRLFQPQRRAGKMADEAPADVPAEAPAEAPVEAPAAEETSADAPTENPAPDEPAAGLSLVCTRGDAAGKRVNPR